METEPGNTAGPTAQGLNTRFGIYQGGGVNPTDHPPDVVTQQTTPPLDLVEVGGGVCEIRQGNTTVTEGTDLNFNHADYVTRIAAANYDNQPLPGGIGAFLRREVAVPIVDCSGGAQGQSTLPMLGFGCMFLLQTVQGGGQNNEIFGEMLETCSVGGKPGPAPGAGPGPFVIQLYRDPDSTDS